MDEKSVDGNRSDWADRGKRRSVHAIKKEARMRLWLVLPFVFLTERAIKSFAELVHV